MHPIIRRALPLALLLAAGACVPQGPNTAAGSGYQAPVSRFAPPANVASICFDDSQLAAYRVRMVQQELAVGTLACKGSDGSRRFDAQYGQFLNKFRGELQANAGELQGVVTAKGRNFDVVVTEIANRTAQQPNTDAAFCSRNQRALEWSLAPSVSSLVQVPSPYDFGPDMNVFPCPH
jgi:hypothetical protein